MSSAIKFGVIVLFAAAVILGAALIGGQPAALAQGDQALVWQVGGAYGRPEGLGALLWQTGGEEPVELADVPDEGAGTQVFPCGAEAVAPDGSYMMAFIGAERGGLYKLTLHGEGELLRIASAHTLACFGHGRATYSPDGRRWAYIDYPADITRTSLYAEGTLRLLNMPAGTETDSVEGVVAFDLRNDGVFYVQFFTNSAGQADEAAVTWEDRSGSREWAAFTPDENCEWTSAALDSNARGDKVVLSLGESCRNRGSQWRLYSVTADADPVEHVYIPSGGRYQPQANDNQVYFLRDEDLALATYPNGRGASIANLVLVDLARNTVTLVTEGITIDAYSRGARAASSALQFSPDGRRVTYVSSTANDEHALHRLDLDGGYQPLTITAGSRGDAISGFATRPDGGIVYVAGSVDGGNNALYLLSAGAGAPERLTRGNFLRDNLVATDAGALVLNYVAPDDDNRTAAANLLGVTSDGGKSLLVDGRQAQAVAYPLWLR